MQILILSVGKLKERYWRDAHAEYTKRLSRYSQIEVVEVEDEPTPETLAPADEERVLRIESERLMRHIKERDAIISLDIRGKTFSSEAWSQHFTDLQTQGFGRFVFVVGGSLGLDPNFLSRSVCRWSFGPLTLPHQLARIVLLEQIYRGFRIGRGEPYHK